MRLHGKMKKEKPINQVRKSRGLLIKYLHPVKYQSVGKMGVMQSNHSKAKTHKTFSLCILYWQPLFKGEGGCLQKFAKRRGGCEIFYKNEG